MKKTLRIISLLLCLFTLSFAMASCGKTQEIKKHYTEVEATLKSSLYDPDSLQVYSAEGVTDEESEYIFYKINANGKNKFGGYVGAQDFYFSYNKTTNKISSCSSSSYEVLKALYDSYQESKISSTASYLKIK